MRLRTVSATALCTATVLAAVGMLPASAAPAPATAPAATAAVPKGADFNGDGYTDLAVSAPGAAAGGLTIVGAVAVTYGSPAGLGKGKSAVISSASEGVPGDPATGDRWGEIEAHGDLDHDGYDDLVVRSKSLTEAHKVLVLWGSAAGLAGGTELDLGADSATEPALGGKVHIADVDRDGKDDIVGNAHLGIGHTATKTGFGVIRGPIARDGRLPAMKFRDTKALYGISAGVNAVADMTGDGRPDLLALGYSEALKKTVFRVFRNTGTGFALTKAEQAVPGKPGYMRAVTVGDFNGDGHMDFAGGHVWSYTYPYGQIYLAYGGPEGLSTTLKPRRIDEDTPGVPGARERFDRWGEALAAGDTNKDGYAELIVGAPEKAGTVSGTTRVGRSGSITVLPGSRTGVTTTGARSITQYTSGVPSTNEVGDRFGIAVTVADGNKDGFGEVYVGGDGEDGYAGRVWQLPGSRTGVTGTGATSFTLRDLGGPRGGAYFGFGFTG